MKTFKSTLFNILVLLNFVNAQEINWQQTIGGSGNDETTDVIQTSDGGFLIGSASNSDISGDKTENSMGGGDIWIVKTNSTGTVLWENTIGGSDLDWVTDLLQTADGGFLLAGISKSNISGDKTQNCKGLYDYWIVKIDSVGNLQWQNTIGGDDNDILEVAIATSDGGFLLAGSSQSDISGDKSENTLGYIDYWIVKTDSAGIVQWDNTIRANNYDALTSAIGTSDGGFLLGGYSNSNISGDKNEDCIGGFQDFWIIKTNSSGAIMWQNTIGGNGSDRLENVIPTNDGGFLVSGFSDSGISGDKTEDNIGSNDYWIIKIDTSGNILWQKNYGGSLNDQLQVTVPAPDNGFLLIGNSNSPLSGSKSENSYGLEDLWIIRIDSSGNSTWQNSIGGTALDVSFCGILTTENGFLLGALSETDISGDKTVGSNGGRDIWLLNISENNNFITGTVFADANSDAILNSGELPVGSMKISEINSGSFAFTQTNGSYSLTFPDTGNYQISPVYSLTYNNISPPQHAGYFSAVSETDSLNDFAFQPAGNFNDLCVSISAVSSFRPGLSSGYIINYINQGTTTLSGTIVFYPDANINYTFSNITPLSITTDSVIFSAGTLIPFQSGQFYISVEVNAGTPIGTSIESRAEILPISGDVNPGCNSAIRQDLAIASFDPNDILVNRAFLLNTELITNPELEYTIRFQNTGTDTAINVRILNTIDVPKVRINSIEIINSSHPVNTRYLPHERNMEFIFNNILLPDSGTNELLSHGFIRYKLNPKTNLLIGDTIQSVAAIYFDLNTPVITNTATTAIVAMTNVSGTISNAIRIYPNPANDKLLIEPGITQKGLLNLTIYDAIGKIVQNKTLNDSEIINRLWELNISELNRGVYFLKITGASEFVTRFVKM